MSLISVIIPCYNYGKYLPDTLNSIINQTYPNWECLIVNDGSTDNTETIAHQFCARDARFKYIFQVNAGISAARNAGIMACNGDYIQLIDADDLLEYKKFEEQVLVLETDPTIDIVYSPVRFFRSQFPEERLFSLGRVNKNWMPNVTGKGNIVVKYLIQNNIVATNCPLFRKRVFEQAGLFNENLKVLEDWDFWLRCSLKNLYFFFLDKPDTFALVRVHSKSISNNTWDMRHMELFMKSDLRSKLKEPELIKILNEQLVTVKKTLVAIAIYDLLKGNPHSFKQKLKTIAGKATLTASIIEIIKHKYFPALSWAKVFFYGKKLLVHPK